MPAHSWEQAGHDPGVPADLHACTCRFGRGDPLVGRELRQQRDLARPSEGRRVLLGAAAVPLRKRGSGSARGFSVGTRKGLRAGKPLAWTLLDSICSHAVRKNRINAPFRLRPARCSGGSSRRPLSVRHLDEVAVAITIPPLVQGCPVERSRSETVGAARGEARSRNHCRDQAQCGRCAGSHAITLGRGRYSCHRIVGECIRGCVRASRRRAPAVSSGRKRSVN